MRKIYKLLVPAFIAVALLASCEDNMDELTVKDASIEKEAVLPPKNKVKLPPGYND